MTFKCSALVKATEKQRFYEITCTCNVYTKEAGIQLNRMFYSDFSINKCGSQTKCVMLILGQVIRDYKKRNKTKLGILKQNINY